MYVKFKSIKHFIEAFTIWETVSTNRLYVMAPLKESSPKHSLQCLMNPPSSIREDCYANIIQFLKMTTGATLYFPKGSYLRNRCDTFGPP